MTYYHCSPIRNLKILVPGKPKHFDKAPKVYMTTLLPMALMYGVRNFEYTYGYTKEGQIYFDEYFPNALEELYRGKSASLYICDPESVTGTEIPNEAVSDRPVRIQEEILIPDVMEALLEQERLGNLMIHRFHQLSEKELAWVLRAEADTIRKKDLLGTPGPGADYYRSHYPDSWALVEAETNRSMK